MFKINPRSLLKMSLTVARFAGPVATGLLAFKSGMRAKDAIEADQYKVEFTEDDSEEVTTGYVGYEDLTKKEKFRVMAPIVFPPIIACAATITASAIDKHMDVKYIKEMNGVCTMALGSVMAYKNKLKEVNPDAVSDVEEELAEKEYPKESDAWNLEVPEHSSIVDGKDLFIMTLSGRRFYSTVAYVEPALKKAEKYYELAGKYYNKEYEFGDLNVARCKSMALNILYEHLGLENTELGYTLGWYGEVNKDTGEWTCSGKELKFNLTKGKNGVYYITPNVAPFDGWYDM